MANRPQRQAGRDLLLTGTAGGAHRTDAFVSADFDGSGEETEHDAAPASCRPGGEGPVDGLTCHAPQQSHPVPGPGGVDRGPDARIVVVHEQAHAGEVLRASSSGLVYAACSGPRRPSRVAGLIEDLPSCEELIERILDEARAALKSLPGAG